MSEVQRSARECRSKWIYLQSDVRRKAARIKWDKEQGGVRQDTPGEFTEIEEKVLELIQNSASMTDGSFSRPDDTDDRMDAASSEDEDTDDHEGKAAIDL